MKPILIIPLMGKRRKNIFNKNNFFFNKTYNFLLNHIFNNFKFCSKIILICKKKDQKFIRFNKSPKINFINLKNSNNQIDTILRVQDKINQNTPLFILNPDALFNFIQNKVELNKYLLKCDLAFFGIKEYINSSKDLKKDTFEVYGNNISSIMIKSGVSDNKKYFTSAGLYFFKNIKFFSKLNSKFIKKDDSKKFNIQLAHLFKNSLRNKKIKYFLVKNFIDFGNQKKYEEYIFWKRFFKDEFFKFDKQKGNKILNIIPAAGEGKRHKELGYNKPKPLIPISSKSMFENSINRLPSRNKNFFIFKKKTFLKFKIKNIFSQNKILQNYFLINRKTKGMAETILLAKDKLPHHQSAIVSSCDISFIINYKKFYKLLKKKPDGIIFTWRQYPFADESPNSHAYVKVKKGRVISISEKKTISKNPNNDYAVTGIFYFKSIKLLIGCIEHMMKNKITVNNEYYVATSMNKIIKDKKKIYNFEVDQFISWSLPEHLQSYNYWEEIFK